MTLRSFSLAGKVALVTGASAGLGAAIAEALAEAGADVACHGNSRAPDATCEAVRSCGRRAQGIRADLAKRPEVDALVLAVDASLGPIDILVNNAGTIRRRKAVEHPDEDWDHVLEVNLTSVFRLSRAVASRWLASGRRGKIVNVASLLAFQGGITVPGYAASKGGVAQLTKALANEWAAHGINVNAVAPGYMVTDNTSALRDDEVRARQILERIPAQRWGEPADLTGAVVFLASPAADYVHGHVLAVDGGWLGR